jgi:hypothetical protein
MVICVEHWFTWEWMNVNLNYMYIALCLELFVLELLQNQGAALNVYLSGELNGLCLFIYTSLFSVHLHNS